MVRPLSSTNFFGAGTAKSRGGAGAGGVSLAGVWARAGRAPSPAMRRARRRGVLFMIIGSLETHRLLDLGWLGLPGHGENGAVGLAQVLLGHLLDEFGRHLVELGLEGVDLPWIVVEERERSQEVGLAEAEE